MARTRSPEIVADAAAVILSKPVSFSGHFCVDETVLRESGQTAFAQYASCPDDQLMPDAFL